MAIRFAAREVDLRHHLPAGRASRGLSSDEWSLQAAEPFGQEAAEGGVVDFLGGCVRSASVADHFFVCAGLEVGLRTGVGSRGRGS